MQNELDNIRAQLSQKGELARDEGLWEASDLHAGRRGPEGNASHVLTKPEALPALYVQESCQLL